MQNEKMLEILRRIQICLKRDSLDIAKDYVRLEIDNLKGITQEKCNSKYYFCDDYYCKKCHNLNCTNNLKELKV